MPDWTSTLRAAMPLPLVLSLAACAVTSPVYVQPVAPPAIPPLPLEARQAPTPSICSPSCSAALTIERENWLRWLTAHE